jgi:hypothetical protein
MSKHTDLTKEQWGALLMEARRLHKEDEKIDRAFSNLFSIFAPALTPPWVEVTQVRAMCRTLEALHGDTVASAVSYWVYDVPMSAKYGKVVCTDRHGKKYDASNLGSYINFLLNS